MEKKARGGQSPNSHVVELLIEAEASVTMDTLEDREGYVIEKTEARADLALSKVVCISLDQGRIPS